MDAYFAGHGGAHCVAIQPTSHTVGVFVDLVVVAVRILSFAYYFYDY